MSAAFSATWGHSSRQSPGFDPLMGGRRDARSCSGFSLVEILVALVVAGVVSLALSSMLLTYLRSSRNMDRAQTARESANRVNYLIQIEASEAKQITTGWTQTTYKATGSSTASAITECKFASGDTPLFSLDVPVKIVVYGVAATVSPIYYYLKAGDLRRCGPEVLRNGQLDEEGATALSRPPYLDGPVMRRASLAVVTTSTSACNSTVTDSRTLVYNITFTDLGWTPPCTVARAKTIFVCNQPSAQMKTDFCASPSVPLPNGSCPTTCP